MDDDNVIEPIRLLDGTLVYPDGEIVEKGEITTSDRLAIIERRRQNATLKSSVADLPVDGKAANIHMLIISYELCGFNHADIAYLLHTDIAHISGIVKSNDHLAMKDFVINKLFEAEKNDARAILAQAAPYAAAKIVGTIKEKGALGFTAAQALLSMQKIGDVPKDSNMRTLEIVVLTQEEMKQKSVEHIDIQINGGQHG